MFTLQLGHPKINPLPPTEFASVRDAFLDLFREEEESVYVFWQEIPLQFRYREDLYHSIDDILAMNWLLGELQGETIVTLSNRLLTMTWKLYWLGDRLEIDAAFEARESLYEAYAESLNKVGQAELSKQEFQQEWNTLLKQILVAFDEGNVRIADGTERRKLELMDRTEQIIAGYGRLYTR